MGADEKRGRGRPRVGREVKVALTDEQLAWLDQQPGKRAEVIRELVAKAMRGEA